MKSYIFPSLKLTLICILVCAELYPLMVAGIATLAPNNGNGTRVTVNNKVVGYENIGQSFTDDTYFYSRPSAVNYNAAGSAGSNKGPSNPEYLQTIQTRIDTFLVHNPGITASQIPADLVTASGSGLDPHISVQAARIQVKRISHIRKLDEKALDDLIDRHIENPLFGLFGPQKINVLKLNIALDELNK